MTTDVDGGDAQDQAEVFDETNITRDGEDIAHPDLADEAQMEAELDMDDGIDEARVFAFDDADRVTTDDARTADYEADDLSDADGAGLGYDEEEEAPQHDPHVERQLDQGLEETFPASDPVSISVGAA